MAYFKEYPYITENIDGSYDPCLNKLKEIIVTTDQLFATQIHQDYGVYPANFADWAVKHPEYKPDSLSVTRIEKGNAKEIPFNIFYADAAQKIAKCLAEAKTLLEGIQDKDLDKNWWGDYLAVLQNAYLHNTWDKAEAYFLTLPSDSPLLLSIGPIDTYHDKIKGTKQFFSAWLLIKNTHAQKETNTLLEQLSKMPSSGKSAKVGFFIGDLLYSGGEVAKHSTIGWSRPETAEVFAKHGGIKVIAFNNMAIHTNRMAQAIEKSLKHWRIGKELGEEVMKFHMDKSLQPLVLHEFSHTFNKSLQAQNNLRAYYTDIEETRANTIMIDLAFRLEKSGHLPRYSTRNIFLRLLLYLPYLYEEYIQRQQGESYYFAALFWMKRAEEKGILEIADTIILNESLLQEKLEEMIGEMVDYLHTLSDKGISQKELSKQKETVFLLGKTIVKIL